MFQIDERQKITLTKGDLASFDCTITNKAGEVRVPEQGDTLKFSIDGTDFEKTAVIEDGRYVFTINSSDTEDLDGGVYYYRVVLNSQFTIIQDCFFELLGDGKEEGAEDEPQG